MSEKKCRDCGRRLDVTADALPEDHVGGYVTNGTTYRFTESHTVECPRNKAMNDRVRPAFPMVWQVRPEDCGESTSSSSQREHDA